MRRLTQQQYRNSIQDIFGPVTLGGRFEPDPRAEQLIAIGAGETTVTASGLEGYDRMAMGIGGQMVAEQRRAQAIPCRPASPSAPDDACAREFLGKAGRLLFRRPLSTAELDRAAQVAADAAGQVKDFYYGLQLALAGMLASPRFLFVQESVEPDPGRSGAYRLTPYALASRLSLLLWNSTPDLELLRAAESGELETRRGLSRQVDRLLGSPRLENGVRAFFADMFHFDEYDDLDKDAVLYPEYNRDVARDAQEQTLRTVVDLLLRQEGDYRDVFTTRKTFITPMLASAYRVPVPLSYTVPTEWMDYEVPADVPQAGILTHFSFLALHSHPGKTSPTLRGKALRETLLCQKVPAPPPDVNFSAFNAAEGEGAPPTTVRERLGMHSKEPACAGCHKITDPIGLGLESFDTVGAFRRTESGLVIDAGGELDRVSFKDANGLGQAMHDNPNASACVVQRLFAYAVGRNPSPSERTWLREHLEKRFAEDGYRLKPLLRNIVLNPGFRRVSPAAGTRTSASSNTREENQSGRT